MLNVKKFSFITISTLLFSLILNSVPSFATTSASTPLNLKNLANVKTIKDLKTEEVFNEPNSKTIPKFKALTTNNSCAVPDIYSSNLVGTITKGNTLQIPLILLSFGSTHDNNVFERGYGLVLHNNTQSFYTKYDVLYSDYSNVSYVKNKTFTLDTSNIPIGNYTLSICSYYKTNSSSNPTADEGSIISYPVNIINSPVNGWIYEFDSWNYYKNNTRIHGWVSDNGTWYFLDKTGFMVSNWQQINGCWYYFASNGSMLTGWQKINNSWYYLKVSGEMVTGWQNISGKWYYFYSNGSMASNTTISGYKLGSDGAWY